MPKKQIFMVLFLLYKQKNPQENKYLYPFTEDILWTLDGDFNFHRWPCK